MIEEKDYLHRRIFKSFWRFFYNSGTVLMQTLVGLSGVGVAAIGAMNAAPLVALVASSGFTPKQLYLMGGILFVQGLAGVVIRLRNTREIAGHLVPKSTEEIKVVATVKDA